MKSGRYDEELAKLQKMNRDELAKLYNARQIEVEAL
jgi:hypothetical protein